MKKGIAMVTLIVIVSVMMILVSTITITGINTSNTAKKLTFASELKMVQENVDSYRVNNSGEFPISDFVDIDLSSASTNVKKQFSDNNEDIDSGTNKVILSKIDYTKVQINNLTYGNQKKGEDDIYVVSSKTGIVYYAKGLKVGNLTYYTLTEELNNLLNYNQKNDESMSDDAIIFEASTLEWTNGDINYTVKVPTSYSNISVSADNGIIDKSNETDEYNEYSFTVSKNCVITVNYNNDKGVSKTAKHSVMNIDKISPKVNAESIEGSSNNKKYLKVDSTDSGSGIKIIKYDAAQISDDEVGKIYFNSNGIEVKNGIIEIDEDIPYITVYSEDKSGNCTIKQFSTKKDIDRYYNKSLILFYDGINNTRSGHSSSTSNWEDLSGNNNDASLKNVSPTENSMKFLGTSTGSGAVSGSINYTKNITFEVLFKTQSSGKFVLDARDNFGAGYQPLYLWGGRSVQVYSSYGGGENATSLNENVCSGNLNLISIVFENNTLYLYVNGVLERTISQSYGNYTAPLYIGRRFSGDSPFIGEIYSVRVYNSSLKAGEILKNFNIDNERFNIK